MKILSRAALAVALVAPAVAGAQGTLVFAMTGQLPDTVKQMSQGMSPESIDLRMTFAYDGNRTAMQLQAGPEMVIPGATFDISSIRLNVIFSKVTDSMHIGVVLPPEITAQLGGGIGFRVDLKIPDSLPMPGGLSVDSIMAETTDTMTLPKGVNTGRTARVAGMTCEEWEFTIPEGQTEMGETIAMCLTANQGLMKQMMDDFMNMPMMRGFKMEKLHARTREMFGGRDLIPIRMVMREGTKSFKFELVSLSNGAPDASFFTLPVDLQPFPLEMFGGAVNQ